MRPIGISRRVAWRAASDPAELFIAMWEVASQWNPADRSALPRPSLASRHALSKALAEEDGKEAVAAVLRELDANWPSGHTNVQTLESAGLVMEAMHVIDRAFESRHPRTRILPPTFGASSVEPDWLDAAERRRLRFGSFAETSTHRLIPNGPFSRHGRGRNASSANSIQDHFPILTVAPRASRHEDRRIAINIRVIGTDVTSGVPASTSIGRERIRFIPLAEAKGDLEFKIGKRGEQPTLDVQPTKDLAARLLAALGDGYDVDLAVAPELTVPGSAETELAGGIVTLARNAPRIVLAGSGLTIDTDGIGRPWNEARIYARGGRLLWRQRKIWPFGMTRTLAIGYDFDDPGADQTLMEDVAGHADIEVADLDGFGRCLVFICQDFECNPLVGEVISRYQPDWVLVPILDQGVKVPGWTHQRGVFLSKQSQARLLVGSSLSLSMHLKKALSSEPPIGLAMGPYEPREESDGTPVPQRAMALVFAGSGDSPRSGLLVWDYAAPPWTQSGVGALPKP